MDRIDVIITGLANGKTLLELSEELNMGYSTIRKFVKDNNIIYDKSTKRKYSDQDIINALKASSTMKETFALLGIPCAGASFQWIKSRLKKLQINEKDFLLPRKYIGRTKLEASDILIVKPEGSHRTTSKYLRNSMISMDIPYECCECAISEWKGQKLTLNVHHINHDRLDNRLENLCFVCPNCHSLEHR